MNGRSVARARPVLHFRGERDNERHYSIAVREEAAVVVEGRAIEPRFIGELAGARFHRADFAVPADAGEVTYSVGDHRATFHARSGPVRIAYTSCNGGEDEDAARLFHTGRNAMWRDLLDTHARDPFALLVMGGDQIYADAVWHEPAFRAWRRLGDERHDALFTDVMREEAEAFFLRRYSEVWAEPEVAEALATIPVVAMWDDHDISDGWGSYPDRERLSPVAQGLFGVARRAFALFQLGVDPDAPGEPFARADGAHYGWTGLCGPVRLVVPDLRSERRLDRVMDEGHALVEQGLAAPGHRVVVSSVPLVNADLSRAERWLRRLGWHKYTDDLRDQWMSYAHRGEWTRLMNRLLDASAAGPVSVLSGEIHLAAHGAARRGTAAVAQYTASGIAHPPPPRAFATLLGRLTRRPWRRDDIELTMHELGETGRRYLAVRNWLEIEADADGLAATVHAEGMGEIAL